jgi:hypothetical protein
MSDSAILDRAPVGNMGWMVGLTGWSHDKISRYALRRLIPGAYRPGPRSQWSFNKAKAREWFDGLQTK